MRQTLVALCLLCIASAGADESAPLSVVDEGAIVVDGDLADWRGMPRTYLSARWHRTAGTPAPAEDHDRAVVSWARDTSALYVGVRVVDEDVLNPYEGPQMWMGDGIELFLDVRPPGTGPGTLGAAGYSPGAYQILVSPVAPDGALQPRWQCMQADVGAPREVQVAAGRLADGYTLEIAIPFAALARDAERFAAPIGVDLAVDDIRRTDDDRGTSGTVQYVLSGHRGNSGNAGGFLRTRPAAAENGVLRRVRPVYQPATASGGSAAAALVVDLGQDLGDGALSLELHHDASAFDAPIRPREIPFGASPTVTRESDSWIDSALGALVVERRLQFTEPPPGRYAIVARYGVGSPHAADTVRAYFASDRYVDRMFTIERPPPESERLDLIGESAYLHLDHLHFFDEAATTVYAGSRGRPMALWLLSELAGNGAPTYSLRLGLTRLADGATVWSAEPVLDRQEVPVPLVLTGLTPGTYELTATVVAPDGRTRPAGLQGDYVITPSRYLTVHRGRDYRLPSRQTREAPRLTRAVPVGDPNRGRYPGDDAPHAFARGIRDLQLYEGRIYVGQGDWYRNQGPIAVWSFGPPAGDSLAFAHEITVDEDSAELFRVIGGRLYLPGKDPKDPWELGNLYQKHEGAWRKQRTIPNGIHAHGIAWHDGRLFVTTGTDSGAVLYASTDWGDTWPEQYTTDPGTTYIDGMYGEMAALGDDFLVATRWGGEYILRLGDDGLERLYVPLFPGLERGAWVFLHRLEPFGEGVLYTPYVSGFTGRSPKPLYWLADLEGGAQRPDLFAKADVQDVIVRDDTAYVLVSQSGDDGYDGAVYATREVRTWHQVARFTTDALAHSLEELGGVFYVGLLCGREEANPASGLICRLE